LIILTFGTFEWIIEEGWLLLLKREENGKQTLEIYESSNSKNTIDHNLLGLFYQQVFSTRLIYSPTKETIVTTPIVTSIMFVSPTMVLLVANVLHIQLPKYHDNDDPVSCL
jgi:hypothetical protein